MYLCTRVSVCHALSSLCERHYNAVRAMHGIQIGGYRCDGTIYRARAQLSFISLTICGKQKRQCLLASGREEAADLIRTVNSTELPQAFPSDVLVTCRKRIYNQPRHPFKRRAYGTKGYRPISPFERRNHVCDGIRLGATIAHNRLTHQAHKPSTATH